MRQEPVSFENRGQRLLGYLHHPRRGRWRRPLVMLCHGFTGDKIDVHCMLVKAARALAESGFLALRFDFRGSGDSEGRFEDVTMSGEIEDVCAALDWACARADVDPGRIGLVGFSLGADIVGCAANRDPRPASVCLWSPFLHDPDQGWFSETPPSPGGEAGEVSALNLKVLRQLAREGRTDLRRPGFWVGRAFFEDSARVRPVDEIRSIRRPMCAIMGGNDPVVRARLYGKLGDLVQDGRLELHEVAGADHIFQSCAWEEEVIRLTRDWFSRTL
ncbi:MAG: alpha/beta fold hydrolase [Acetobacteraceae bacterium]|nr:alpha/beta fold hydrolase [Acetobacteraceae bacterium]